MLYGGKLLAHLSSDSPDEVEGAISLLRINRNCCVVMDSDKQNAQAEIGDTKKRLKAEIDTVGGYSWVTEGREIENYIPASAIASVFESKAGQVGRYRKFKNYLNRIRKGEGQKFDRQKPQFAERITPSFTSPECFKVLDLKEKIEGLCQFIRKCNGMKD